MADAFRRAAERAAARAATSATTLAHILGVEPDLLKTKFGLQPHQSHDPLKKDNLVFLSITVLLEDLELREGGWKDRGAKEVLALLAKDILESKDHSFFQVPEITLFHMGYGRNSQNKKSKMALTETEAKEWMDVLDLAKYKASREVAGFSDATVTPREGDTPMDIDFTFPTAEDNQALESEGKDSEEIDPRHSGLQIKVKSRYLLFFSILLIFYKKKCNETSSIDKESHVGANKVSDFILFWILPYLLNYTQQQVTIVNEHHKAESKRKGEPEFSVPVVKKSAMDIIENALKCCEVPIWLADKLLAKFTKYYGTDQLKRKYSLPAVVVRCNEPVILVPLRYQVTNMPYEIEDIGRKWQEIGDVRLVDEFINKFIENREIQEDFLCDAICDLEWKEKCGVNYGILLPDEKTFEELIKIEDKHTDLFRNFKCTCLEKQGRDFATPRLGIVKNGEKNLSVCFSYFEDQSDGKKVARLFRVTGSHRVNHFTLAVLHGSCINPYDPTCKLLSLYPVKAATKFEFKNGILHRCKLNDKNKKKSGEGFLKGHFCKLEYPETFKSWNTAVQRDTVIKDFITNSRGKRHYPEFEHQYPLTVAYVKGSSSKRLKKSVFGAAVAPTSRKESWKRRMKKLRKYQVRAASLEGCLLYFIARSGSKGNIATVMAINDTLEPCGAILPGLTEAVRRTIVHFVMAVVVAGLSKVYPAEGSDAERVIESGTDEEEDEDDEEDDSDSDDEDLSNSHSDGYEPGGTNAHVLQPPAASPKYKVKPGIPSHEKLGELSQHIGECWKCLGRQLNIAEGCLTGFHKENEEYREKPYKMLLHWQERDGSNATYQVLYNALCHKLVNQRHLAENICCDKMN